MKSKTLKNETKLDTTKLFTGAPVVVKQTAYAKEHTAMVYAVNDRGIYLILEGASAVCPLPFRPEQLRMREGK